MINDCTEISMVNYMSGTQHPVKQSSNQLENPLNLVVSDGSEIELKELPIMLKESPKQSMHSDTVQSEDLDENLNKTATMRHESVRSSHDVIPNQILTHRLEVRGISQNMMLSDDRSNDLRYSLGVESKTSLVNYFNHSRKPQ